MDKRRRRSVFAFNRVRRKVRRAAHFVELHRVAYQRGRAAAMRGQESIRRQLGVLHRVEKRLQPVLSAAYMYYDVSFFAA